MHYVKACNVFTLPLDAAKARLIIVKTKATSTRTMKWVMMKFEYLLFFINENKANMCVVLNSIAISCCVV